MKKLLIVLLVLAVLAGAACAYWFGYQWYLERGWQAAAERIEAKYFMVDVAEFEYFPGKEVSVYIDPVNRVFETGKDTYIPYVLVAVRLAGEQVPDDEMTVALFNDIMAEAKNVAGKNTKVIVVMIDDAGGYYVANCFVELHTAVEIRSIGQIQINPLWWQTFPSELVRFPGRADD